MYRCGVNYTVPCLMVDDVTEDFVTGCCPPEARCSSFGCVMDETSNDLFVSSVMLMWISAGVPLCTIIAGVFEFLATTYFYCCRRRRSAQRLQRYRQQQEQSNVNAEIAPTDSTSFFPFSSTEPRASTSVSELDGHCCGCGGAADTILLPCSHAVCCHECAVRATHCPFCKEVCEGQQRLFPV